MSHNLPATSTDEEIDPIRYLATLWRYRWMILTVPVVCGLAAFFVGRLSPPKYEASVKVLVTPPQTNDPGDAAPLASLAPYRALFENQSLAATVISEFRLDGAPFHLTPQRFLSEALTLDSVKETNMIVLKVRLQDAQLPAKIVNRVAELCAQLDARVNQDQNVRSQAALKAEMDHARERLDEADQRLTVFKQKAQIEALKTDVRSELAERADLLPLFVKIQVEKARLAMAEEELARRKPTGVMKKSLESEPAMLETARDQQKNAGLLGLQLTNEYVNEVYRDLDGEVAQTRLALSGLERKRAELVESRKLSASQLASLNRLYEREAELGRLQADYDMANGLHTDVSKRYEQFRLKMIGRGPHLEIVERAFPSGQPVSPRVLRNTALGFGAGLGLSVVLALVIAAVREFEGRRALP